MPVYLTSDAASVDVDGRAPLVFTDALETDLLAGSRLVEHVLPGASSGYLERRRSIGSRYYDLAD